MTWGIMPLLPVSVSSSFLVGLRASARRSPAKFARQLSSLASCPSQPSCLPYSHGRRVGLASSPLSPAKFSREQVRSVFNRSPRIVTHYNQIPSDYEDANGLPFRKEELTQQEVKTIFGPALTAEKANKLLKIIHGRRVAGTLEDPSLQRNTIYYTVDAKVKAIEYLRQILPVDEILCAGLRAEDELKFLEQQEKDSLQAEEQAEEQPIEEKPQKRKSKRPSVETVREAPKVPTGRLPNTSETDSPYGVSNFDRIRAKNLAAQAEEEARRQKEEEERLKQEGHEGAKSMTEHKGAYVEGPDTARTKYVTQFVQKYADRATSDLEAPPEMKAWERLLPSVAMTLLVCALCALFATTYTPPRQSRRLWPDVPPAAATVCGLILMNIAVAALWRVPPAWPVLNRYFMIVSATPRPLQMIGALFSHQKIGHLVANIIFLGFFGMRLHDEIGRGNFLAVYFASGAISYMGSLSDMVLRRGLTYTSLGASGAIYGIIAAYFWLHKLDEFRILGMPPEPITAPHGVVLLAILLGFQLVGFMGARKRLPIDFTSHVCGIAGGVVAIDLVKKRMDSQARLRAERMKGIAMNMMDTKVETKPPSLPT